MCVSKRKKAQEFVEMDANVHVVVPFQPKNFREPKPSSKETQFVKVKIIESDLSIQSISGAKKRSSFSRARSAAQSNDGWTAGTFKCAEWNAAQIYCERGLPFFKLGVDDEFRLQ